MAKVQSIREATRKSHFDKIEKIYGVKEELTPYERMMAMMDHKFDDVDRLPVFCPARTYTLNGMKLWDAYWPESHLNPAKMADLALSTYELSGNENISVPFDMTMEAEALGATAEYFKEPWKIKWISIKPPFIAKDLEDMKIPEDPEEIVHRGRIPVCLDAIKMLHERYYGIVPVTLNVNCPITSVGSYVIDPVEFHKYMIRDPEKVKRIYKALNPVYAAFINAALEAGADAIWLQEEGASLDNISPKHFQEFAKPNLSELIKMIKTPRTMLHICGQLISGQPPEELEVITQMIDCGASMITIEERTDMARARALVDKHRPPKKPGYPSIPLGGNINAYKILYGEALQDISIIDNRVERMVKEGADMMCPGCDYWLETPVTHLRRYVAATINYGTPPRWKKK